MTARGGHGTEPRGGRGEHGVCGPLQRSMQAVKGQTNVCLVRRAMTIQFTTPVPHHKPPGFFLPFSFCPFPPVWTDAGHARAYTAARAAAPPSLNLTSCSLIKQKVWREREAGGTRCHCCFAAAATRVRCHPPPPHATTPGARPAPASTVGPQLLSPLPYPPPLPSWTSSSWTPSDLDTVPIAWDTRGRKGRSMLAGFWGTPPHFHFLPSLMAFHLAVSMWRLPKAFRGSGQAGHALCRAGEHLNMGQVENRPAHPSVPGICMDVMDWGCGQSRAHALHAHAHTLLFSPIYGTTFPPRTHHTHPPHTV